MATEFKLPEVGEGIESGVVVGLLVSVGDTVEVDQPVLELETDKAVVEVPSSVSGVVESINVKQNEEAQVGQVILTVGEGAATGGDAAGDAEGAGDADGAEEAGGAGETGGVAAVGAVAAAEEEGEETSEESAEGDGATRGPARGGARREEARPEGRPDGADEAQRAPGAYEGSPEEGHRLVPAAPSVRRLAREMGVDIRRVAGSGTLGRISAEDVVRFAEGGAPSPAAPTAPAAPAQPRVELPDFSRWGEVERAPMNGVRKATVRSMTAAWGTVPMVTHFDKADVTEFEALRKRYAPKAEAAGAKLTPTAMILRVVAGALRKFPDFNASLDVEAQEIVYKRYVNLGVAVDTPSGLLVPVIKHADRKNMIELAVELGELAEKARARKLSPDEMQGGNFSVSNLGGIGGTGFTPIVNPPDVAILGVSRGSYEPVYDRETGEFEARQMMPLSLTYDHRLIDGASAARFLRWVCTALEDPFLLALEG